MKDIVEFIVKQFVSNPDAVEVTEQPEDGYLNILLKVAPEDMGLTIGKNGQTIKAIRRLLTIKAISENMRVNLELVDSGVKPEASQDQKDSEDLDRPEDEKAGESETTEDITSDNSDTPDKAEQSDSQSPSEPSENKSDEEAS